MLGREAGPFAPDLEDHAGVEVREGQGGRFWARLDVSEFLQGLRTSLSGQCGTHGREAPLQARSCSTCSSRCLLEGIVGSRDHDVQGWCLMHGQHL